jgi:Tol biopolymer transport system component/DNA-binding winged helix-turn-helix (wHTH) protein
MNRSDTRFYEFDDFRVDAADRRLFHRDQEVPLPPKVFETLLLLLEKPGQLVSKDELMDRLWPGTFVGEDTLAQKISLLRKALNGGNGSEGYISTVPKLGYRFEGSLRNFSPLIVPAESPLASEIILGSETAEPAKIPQRNRSLLIGASLAFVIFAAGAAWLGLRSFSRPWAASFRISELDVSNFSPVGVISPDGKYLAYVSPENGKSSIWVRNVDAAGKGLEVVPSITGNVYGLSYSPDDEYLYYVLGPGQPQPGALYRINPLGGAPQRLIDAINGGVEFDPTGKRMVFKRSTRDTDGVTRPELLVANADGSAAQVVAKTEAPVIDYNGYHWSPDEKIVYAESVRRTGGVDFYVAEIPASGGKETRIFGPDASEITMVQELNHSELLSVARDTPHGEPQVWIFTRNAGKRRVTNDTSRYTSATVSPSSHKILANRVDIEGSLWLINISPPPNVAPQDSVATAVNIPPGKYGYPVFTPDGNIIYSATTASGGSDLWWVRSDGTGARRLTTNGAHNSNEQISLDGKFLVFTVHDKGTSRIWRLDIDGSEMRQLTTGTDDDDSQISPDGNWVVYNARVAGQWSVWKVPSQGGTAIRIADSIRTPPRVGPLISPDGKSIALPHLPSLTHHQQWEIVSFDDGSLREELDLPETCYAVSWSPDGKSLVYLPNHQELWSQAIKGKATKMIANLGPGEAYDFNWSQDNTKMVFLRRAVKTSMVLISDTN